MSANVDIVEEKRGAPCIFFLRFFNIHPSQMTFPVWLMSPIFMPASARDMRAAFSGMAMEAVEARVI
jgi:hypothetical protein